MRELSYREALAEGLREEMRRDPTVFLMGEDIKFGALAGVTKGFVEEFGGSRVLHTPIAESGFVAAALGAALTGMRPVVEIQLADFLLRAMDSIANQAAKYRYMCGGGEFKAPMVIRAALAGGVDTGFGCHHSQSLEATFMHYPGLKVVYPSTPYDAKGLMKAAIRDNNPVLLFEHKLLYSSTGPVPDEDYAVPLGEARVLKEGKDVTVVAIAWMATLAFSVAEELEREGVSVEVLDPRTLLPLDREAILASVGKTGRLVIAEESTKTGGAGAEIAAVVSEAGFRSLKAPVVRLAGADLVIPSSDYGARLTIPHEAEIKGAILSSLGRA